MKRMIALIALFALVAPLKIIHGEISLEDRTAANTQIEEKKLLIEQLEAKIQELRSDIQAKSGEAKTVEGQVKQVEREITKINTTITALRTSLEATQLKAALTERNIEETTEDIDRRTLLLGEQVRLLDTLDHERGFLTLLFLTQRYRESLQMTEDIVQLNARTKASVDILAALHQELEEQIAVLEEQRTEQAGLLALQSIEKEEARRKKVERERLFANIKSEAKKLQEQESVTKKIVESLRTDIYALLRIGVTIEDAIAFGKLVAERAGIRPAFLLALLEVESRLGLSVGTGNWKADMNPEDHDEFVLITTKLGLDPDVVPVSKKPSYGWGGAMGPAQFIPRTWLGYEAEVARLTGHNPPSPWNIEDAFMAAAIKLRNDGAGSKERAGELAAANKYISGNPNCTKQICSYYRNLVLDKAADIEAKLGQ